MGEKVLGAWLSNRKLPEGRTIEAFQRQVQDQLIKDFQWDAERVHSASVNLLQLLVDEIVWGLEGDASALFASFYRLDLGEGLMGEILSQHERPKAAQILAEKSLERAALKVWMRWTFGQALPKDQISE